jgi:hypothetical protein
MDARRRELFVVGWLFLIHGLADIAIGVFRRHVFDPSFIDVSLTALARSQLCLLAIWLALGRARLTWRLSGLIGGTFFLFIVLSRAIFPGITEIGRDSQWLEPEWEFYYQLWRAGDFVVKIPLLIAGVCIPLVVVRALRFAKSAGEHGEPTRASLANLLQFRLQDIAIWVFALALGFGAFRTAPYTDWFQQLFERWWSVYRVPRSIDVYCLTSALIYVAVALVSLQLVRSKPRLLVRLFLFVGVSIGPAVALDVWGQTMRDEFAAAFVLRWPETLTSLSAAAVIAGSLLLVRFYEIFMVKVYAV